MALQISPLQVEDITSVISLFMQEISELKAHIPELPDFRLDEQGLMSELRTLISSSQILAAFSEQDAIVGYLGWNTYDHFRGVNRRTAYSPEYAHAAPGHEKNQIYQALYNAASINWYKDSCEAFILTVLSSQKQINSFWFWNGFGLLVVDAVRSLAFPLPQTTSGIQIRKANLSDLGQIVQMDQEHFQHYSQPPTLMVPRTPRSPTQITGIINSPGSSIWIAKINRDLIGFMSFEPASQGATMLVNSDSNIAISSAYVQPHFRGNNVGLGILENALGEYAERGFKTCSVDFESVNPFAAHFWMKFFTPICYSIMRVPEYNSSSQFNQMANQ